MIYYVRASYKMKRGWVSEGKHYLPIILLFFAVAYTGWLLHNSLSKPAKANTDTHSPDFIIKEVYVIETNDQGQIKNKFMSPKVVHYTLNNTYYYTQPHVIAYSDDNKAPWDITAVHGQSINGTKKIILWDHVNIHENSGPSNQDSLLQTSWMVIFPALNYAETDKPVTFIQPDLTVHAIGMKLYFKEKKVILLHQAKGVYDDKS